MANLIIRNKFPIAAFFIAIFIWPMDAAVEMYRLQAASFANELFHPSGIEVFHRVSLSILVIVFGFFVHWATRRLYRNQEHLNLILSSVNAGLWEWAPESDQCDFSSNLIRNTLGYGAGTADKCSLKDWAGLIHPDEKQSALQAMKELSEGKRERFEDIILMRHKDGDWRHIRFRAFPELRTGKSKPTRIFGSFADVTEQTKLQEALSQKAKQLNTMLTTTTDGYWLCDKTGRILDANAAYCDMVGFSRDEIVHHSISDFEITESPEQVEAHMRKIFATGFDRFESKHLCKDGSTIDVEVSVSFMKDQEQFVSFFRDITERNKNREELLRLSRVVEQTSEGVMIVNKAGTIEYVNPAFCRNTGYTLDEAVGQNPSLLKSGAQNDEFYTHMWAAISKGESWRGSVVDQRKDGSFFPALLSIFPILNEGGEHIYYVGIQQDISELKRLEDQLIQSQKMEAIGNLVGGIAHDFNNLLAAIDAGIFLAKRKINKAPEDAIVRLKDIETLIRRGSSMIKQMMAFARKGPVQLDSLSLNSVLAESIRLARPAIPSNIELAIDFREDDLIINGDATQIQQVILNLMNNARDAGAGVPQPRIECMLQRFTPSEEFTRNHPEIQADQLAHLIIRDNGAGIPEDHITKIFEPFFSTKGAGKGTGLGLSMVYGSIKTHSGAIEVESELGRGTAFHIYLPLVVQQLTSAQAQKSDIHEGEGETILVVDDEEHVRIALGDMLDSIGYTVLVASDGSEAFEKIKDGELSIALIVTDMVMPKMSGVELAIAVRELGHDIPIIIATGYDRENMIEEADNIARSIVVKKPFPPQEMSKKIREMLNNT